MLAAGSGKTDYISVRTTVLSCFNLPVVVYCNDPAVDAVTLFVYPGG